MVNSSPKHLIFFQWKLRIWTFRNWEFSGKKFRPRTVILSCLEKLAWKTSKMMSVVGPYQKCQFWLDDDIKQDSHSWMSKLLLKKRKIEIGLELVIFNKKLLRSKNSTFFTSEKNSSNLKQKKLFSFPYCGFK